MSNSGTVQTRTRTSHRLQTTRRFTRCTLGLFRNPREAVSFSNVAVLVCDIRCIPAPLKPRVRANQHSLGSNAEYRCSPGALTCGPRPGTKSLRFLFASCRTECVLCPRGSVGLPFAPTNYLPGGSPAREVQGAPERWRAGPSRSSPLPITQQPKY